MTGEMNGMMWAGLNAKKSQSYAKVADMAHTHFHVAGRSNIRLNTHSAS
jgi:hypothetical protein